MVTKTPLYRINVGGPVLVDPAAVLNWASDDGSNPSPYHMSGGNLSGTANPIDITHPSIPANTPMQLFQQEVYDGIGNLTYVFPALSAGTYEVRIYVAELYSGITAAGQRVFHGELNGVTPAGLSSIDPFDLSGGFQKGAMVSGQTTLVTTSDLTITFGRVIENPAIKGIEILSVVEDVVIPPAMLGIDSGTHDFGSVTVNSSATHTFILTHTGEVGASDVIIHSVSFDTSAYTTDFAAPATLAVGETRSLNVTFEPTVTGTLSGVMTVNHSGDNSPLTASLTGAGTQEGLLAQSTTSQSFGTVTIGNAASRSFTVTNLGTGTQRSITISGITFSGLNGDEFAHTETLPIVIAAGTSATIDLRFVPVDEGTKTASVTLTTDADSGNVIVSLSATATAPVIVENPDGVVALANMILDHVETHLFTEMILNLPEDAPTRVAELRPGKLQDDPTPGTGLNILIYAVNEEMPFQLHSDNVQDGLQSPVGEVGGGWFYKHPYVLRFVLHFRGERNRSEARRKAQIVFARAKWALSKMGMPQHPTTGLPRDDFGEVAIELQISKGYLNEGGGPGHFIWRGELHFEFLTEQISRHIDLYLQ